MAWTELLVTLVSQTLGVKTCQLSFELSVGHHGGCVSKIGSPTKRHSIHKVHNPKGYFMVSKVIPVLKPLATHPWQRLGSLSRVALVLMGEGRLGEAYLHQSACRKNRELEFELTWFADFRIWIDSIV